MPQRPTKARARARAVAVLVTTAATLGVTGCATMQVKPSEREVLSRKEMDPTTKDEVMESEWESHIESSRDWSIGGHGAAGGGCGCG